MSVRPESERRHRLVVIAIVCLTALCTLMGLIGLAQWAGKAAERELRANAHETSAVQAQALNGLMEKFRLLPNLMGRYPIVTDAFSRPDPSSVSLAEQTIKQIVALSGALDILLLSPEGTVIASGHPVAYRPFPIDSPLLQAARQGRLGRELRSLAGSRYTYAFANGVRGADNKLIGIVVVLVNTATLERAWSLASNPVLVVDKKGTVLFSNRQEWRQQAHFDISKQQAAGAHYWLGGIDRPYMDVARYLPRLGWRLHVLADTAPIGRARIIAGGGAILFGVVIGWGLISLANRQFASRQKQERDRALALHLEQMVLARTRELTRSNEALAHEVDERRTAENSLRQMQAELVQTGKLAALGQMSAALSHEYNQPLAATKSYADNALAYLERNRIDNARENIHLISEMTDRMAQISKHLRNFARKPRTEIRSVSLNLVIDDAISVLSARIRSENARIDLGSGLPELWVRGGHVRLQQVMINLISNGLDAMAKQESPEIAVRVTADEHLVTVSVRDFGKGIDENHLDEIFDPFFTTKPPGNGLGLGLSISYNIVKDFGGRLTATNHLEGGAVFTLELTRAEPISRAVG